MIARTITYGRRQGILAAGILLLAAGTFLRNPLYRSEIDLWSAAVQASPGKQRTHHNLGCALAKADRHEEALRSFRQVLAQKVDGTVQMHLLYIEMGNASYHLDRYDEALTFWRKALALTPGNGEVLTNMAVALFRMGKIEDAENHAKAALAWPKAYAQTMEVLGDISLQKRKFREAAGFYEAAAGLHPDQPSHVRNAALAYEQAGDIGAARILIERYMKYAIEGPAREEAALIYDRIRASEEGKKSH